MSGSGATMSEYSRGEIGIGVWQGRKKDGVASILVVAAEEGRKRLK